MWVGIEQNLTHRLGQRRLSVDYQTLTFQIFKESLLVELCQALSERNPVSEIILPRCHWSSLDFCRLRVPAKEPHFHLLYQALERRSLR
jgi:hypothetical protein